MSLPYYKEIIFDLVGLGFGPANIAVAGALTEQWEDTTISAPYPVKKALFIEKHKSFRWHPGMLLPDARMQISFMKDLATLRNPKSPYTFLSYLHSQGRLVSFINRASTIPTRKEYSDYLSWAACRVQEKGVNVLYGHEVVGISSATDDTVAIRCRNLLTGEEDIIKSRNIIISPGGCPRIPPVLSSVVKHPHIVHSSSYATSISKILGTLSGTSRDLRLAVIGSGQSAAEVTMDLRRRLSNIPSVCRHQVDMLIRKGALKPSDDSPFANEIFDPAATDTWYSLSTKQLRDMRLAEYKLTNYGVVNSRTLEALYETIYDQGLDSGIAHRLGNVMDHSEPFINVRPYTFITSVKFENEDTASTPLGLLLSPENIPTNNEGAPRFSIATRNVLSLETAEQHYDAIVYATGYERSSWVTLLRNSDIARHFGLSSLSTDVRLMPVSEDVALPQPSPFSTMPSDCGASSPSTISSTDSSPPTSPDMGSFSSQMDKGPRCEEVYISRNYRLIPSGGKTNGKEYGQFTPRIYLQGVEENTHGLSDTLLSVIGVRAGEVIRDLTFGA
ncbi:hypothetical protein GALMADRAFT_221537 [Galerina marginata CBS 339.88]|uniref:L-ornithine N(5)-monooxygenase [NAD(P)H] n=1 Tax=Galerina marginata (strain CBS 339.88) TaxID=685588 RepID=A0A067TEL9_GALM3|nr:hypothetical protein GALMADRAFT_221537 [Galerina marginata CBS 339.88]